MSARSLCAAALAAALITGVGAGCETPGDEEPALADAAPDSIAALSRITAREVYVRWAAGSATIDYFLRGDRVDVHGVGRRGKWYCVTGRTRYGLKRTGWVSRGSVRRSAVDRLEGVGRCRFGATAYGDFEISFRNCRIKARGAFRMGPRGNARVIKGKRAPDGFLDPAAGRTCLGRASSPLGGKRPAVNGYVWAGWRPDKDPKGNVAPGRTGWFAQSRLDCRSTVTCDDDRGVRDPLRHCGDGTCSGIENDRNCPADCGCAATPSCSGVAPSGCHCDASCAQEGDCCADVDTCTQS